MGLTDALNDRQKEAVLTTEGPVLVLAGAGSGKTRALTYRIAYLIGEKKVDPWNILAITFTNKAAAEMKTRVNDLVAFGAESIWVSTFHSMCVRMLRRYADRIGFDTSFTIYDADDSKTLMHQLIKSLDMDPKQYKEKGVLADISSAKNELITPEEFARQNAGDYRKMQIGELYTAYQDQMKKNNAMDFDDLIGHTVHLLETDREVREYYQEKFRYILVDEYQDTNTAQFRLIELLAGKYKNLCVVGDDDQSIYKFRGANIYNILNFEREYPGAKVIRLEQNYRSTQNILDAANGVIAHNEGRKEKHLWTQEGAGSRVRFCVYDTGRDEAEAVVKDIEKAVQEGTPRKECAVLYRTNAQSRAIEEACVAHDLPYRLVGGVNFYQRMEIKDILAYLKTIDNAVDDLAVQRIINVPKRGIGQTTINKLVVFGSANDMSFYDACRHATYIPGMGKAAAKVEQFVEEMEKYRQMADEEPLEDLIRAILKETGYQAELEAEGTVEAESRLQNLEELISKAVDFEKNKAEDVSLKDFLEQVALVADIDTVDPDADRVFLMTLHSAKGLEFEHVYMVGMDDGLFPSYRSIVDDDRDEVEEERRLCYVGITRAKRELLLTSARSRVINGETRYNKPSRFVEEIPDSVLTRNDESYGSYGSPFRSGDSYDGSYGNSWKSGNSFGRSRGDGEDSYEDGYSSWGRSRGGSSYGDSYGSGRGGASYGDSYASSRGGQQGGSSFGHGHYGSVAYLERQEGLSPDVFDKKKPSKKKTENVYVTGKQLAASGKKQLDFQVGDRVKHVKFGVGTVAEIKEQPTDFQVTVDFDEAGTKKMYAQYAKLEKQ